jgi:hypothetical protein
VFEAAIAGLATRLARLEHDDADGDIEAEIGDLG